MSPACTRALPLAWKLVYECPPPSTMEASIRVAQAGSLQIRYSMPYVLVLWSMTGQRRWRVSRPASDLRARAVKRVRQEARAQPQLVAVWLSMQQIKVLDTLHGSVYAATRGAAVLSTVHATQATVGRCMGFCLQLALLRWM